MLSIIDFGKQLIELDDLDPVYTYCLTWNDENLRKRFILAYLCFYHIGVARDIAISSDFYYAFDKSIDSQLRGRERRYFYGNKAKKTLAHFKDLGTPEEIVDNLIIKLEKDYQSFSEEVSNIPNFGDWAVFKLADMLERCVKNGVIYEPFLPQEAVKCLEILSESWNVPEEEILNKIKNEFRYTYAPPKLDRKVNLQEIETILCKYKAYMAGRYEPGEDKNRMYDQI